MSARFPRNPWSAAQALSWVGIGLPIDWPSWDPVVHGKCIPTAQNALVAKIKAGDLLVWARQEGRLHKNDPLEVRDGHLFTRFPLTVHPMGDIRPPRPGVGYTGKCFEEAMFDRAAVQRAFPRPGAKAALAHHWMLAEIPKRIAKTRHKPKRNDIIADCIQAFRAMGNVLPYRDAVTAYQALPPELRRTRGERV